MRNKIVGILVCMLVILAIGLPAVGTLNIKEPLDNNHAMKFAPCEIIVKLKKDTTFSRSSLTALNVKHQVYAVEKVFPNAEGSILDNIYLLSVPSGSDVVSIVYEYGSCPDVLYAELNGIVSPCGVPNDTNFSIQWYLHNTGQVIYNDSYYHIFGTPDADIDAPEAWDMETGSSEVVIAIIDTGIDYTHPDLAVKIWNNTDEIPGNSIDDDTNGYIDDVMGWDFCYNDSEPKDEYGHGSMCAGIAGASTNNSLGIAGVAWNCKIMNTRVMDEDGSGLWVNISQGIRYAADNGANVISMSFGGGQSNVLKDAVNYAYSNGVFLCAAAGNDNRSTKFYPAAYDNVTAVAMTNQNDSRVTPEDWNIPGWGSRFGDWVDIAAPGNAIYTTMPSYHVTMNDDGLTQNYTYCIGGTSYATPMVAGVAALLLSINPLLSPDETKTLLCGNVDPYNSTEYIGTGRLNAQKALTALLLSDMDVDIKGGFGVKMILTSNGTRNIPNISWQIHVEGGMLGMINKTVNGTIDIPAGDTVTVKTGILLGFGAISIVAKVADEEQTAEGTQLIIFSMVKK